MANEKSVHHNIWTEIKARWKSKSPYLFRIIQRISGVSAFLSGLFLAIQATGFTISEPFNTIGSKTVIITAIFTYIVAKLPVDTHEATKEVLKEIDDKPE